MITAINLREVDREQLLLLPPSIADWLPQDHLAYFVFDVIAELDLSEFYADYRDDGRGGATYDPATVLATLLYAYCLGEHSSRRIERRLKENIAFRIVAANQQTDHATLARFRRRHEEAIAGLFCQVLGLCARAGLVAAKVVSIDATKLEANASAWSDRTRRARRGDPRRGRANRRRGGPPLRSRARERNSGRPGEKARKMLAEIRDAEDRDHALFAANVFIGEFQGRWPKAAEKIRDDLDQLLRFYDFPLEHWIHLKTSNPIESTFSPVRARTRVTKGAGSRAARSGGRRVNQRSIIHNI